MYSVCSYHQAYNSAVSFHVKARQMQEPRVDIRRLLRVLLFAGIVPLIFLIWIDLASGYWPIFTLAGIAIFLPLGSFLVGRAALDEMNKVIDEVAPLEEELDEDADDEGSLDRSFDESEQFED